MDDLKSSTFESIQDTVHVVWWS